MEREALRMKEEKEKKEQETKDKTASRFGAAASGMPAGGGKWVPSRMRAEGSVSLSDRFAGVGGGSQKLDTEDENLFPDLAAADAIMEKKKYEQPAYAAPKKTPVGGGAAWGGRPKLNLKPKSQSAKEEEDAPTSTEDQPVEDARPAEEALAPEEPPAEAASAPPPKPVAPTPATAAPASASIKPTKKKKKDISTFGKK
jgi:hypothetical protein